MNCHCNVVCMSIRSIKYVLKYVHKGCDQAMYHLQTNRRAEADKSLIFKVLGTSVAMKLHGE